MHVNDLDTPALVLDLDRVEENVREMALLTGAAGVRLRPHTKTHKMPEMAQLQRAAGAQGITCAKLGEAEVMAAAGFDDILIAFPLVGEAKIQRLALLRESARVLVALDSLEVARPLGALGVATRNPIEVYIEVDTGLHRVGRAPGLDTVNVVTQVARIEGIKVLGLLSHAGHAYKAVDGDDRRAVVARQIDDLLATQHECRRAGVEVAELSVGSTPSVREEMRHRGVSEVRPGTYIFNDTTMIRLGVATQASCAAHVLATVVSRPRRDRFVIDAGTKCLGADGLGQPGWIQVSGRDDLSMEFLSEEHGIGVIDPSSTAPPVVGDKLLLIPYHVCPVINLFDIASLTRAEQVEGTVRVAARGLVR